MLFDDSRSKRDAATGGLDVFKRTTLGRRAVR